jgi:hypothetical protein
MARHRKSRFDDHDLHRVTDDAMQTTATDTNLRQKEQVSILEDQLGMLNKNQLDTLRNIKPGAVRRHEVRQQNR